MTLCVFALIASEFMPVSLLTPIATDLGVSEGLADTKLVLAWLLDAIGAPTWVINQRYACVPIFPVLFIDFRHPESVCLDPFQTNNSKLVP